VRRQQLQEVVVSRFSPHELRAQLAGRLLCFPVTHATPDFGFDERGYREHLEMLAAFAPGAMTAPGGTGEFFSLSPAETRAVLAAAVATKPAGSAVLGAAGYGTSVAMEMARDVTEAGADGLFLLPTYLAEVDQRGLVEHVAAVCAATPIGVLLYHRGASQFTLSSVLELADRCPNLIGFKDGAGDIGLMSQLAAQAGDRLVLVDGMPTAEEHALAYVSAGVHSYSSAIFNFMPQWAMDFHRAVQDADQEWIHHALRTFVGPLIELRDRRRGYSVAMIKAGMTVMGRSAGPVRPPLTDLSADEMRELASLVEAAGAR
jgi:5-dehydro-4-deoxyglucarate dehydratase